MGKISKDVKIASGKLGCLGQEEAVSVGFVKVSKMYIAEMTELAQRSSSAHTVLWTLIQQMSEVNSVMISHESLCKLTRLSPATVKRAISLLREQQWLEVLKVGTANMYRVNSEVIWQDRDDGRWASFHTNVILNFDEQDDITKAQTKLRTRHVPLVEADDMDTARVQPELNFVAPKD